MPDPATTTTAAVALSAASNAAATAAAVSVAFLGVDHRSAIFALLGAMFAVAAAEPVGLARALLHVCLATALGAVGGNLIAERSGITSTFALLVACAACGLCVTSIAFALVRAAPRVADRIVRRWASGEAKKP